MVREQVTLVPVGSVLEKIHRQPKVKKSDYEHKGMLPIIDQGADFIGGYTDDESIAYQGKLPVVIFGDHTRILKFVTSPFAVGADGTQLLRPCEGWDIRYFYYCLLELKLKNYGYERHFKYLKEERIPQRPLQSQQKISSFLSAYDALIENNTRRIQILEQMAQMIYREWFVNFRFPGHEKVKLVESPLGKIPQGWEVSQIGRVVETLGGGTPNTKNPAYWEDGTINWFTPSDLTSAKALFLGESSRKITELGLDESSANLFPANSVMMTSRATIGAIAINTAPATTNQGFITCVPSSPLSVYHIVAWERQNMEIIISIASGATFKEISRGEFRELPICVPPEHVEQHYFGTVDPMYQKIRVLLAKNANLRRTRDLLLPKLISGELDVSELDIATAEKMG